jgi:cytochrome P450
VAAAAVRLSSSPWVSLMRFRRDPLAYFEQIAPLGDIVQYRMGPRQVTFLNHPDHIKDLLVTSNRKFIKSMVLQRAKRVLGEGLLTSEGEFHLRQRRLSQPAFHRDRIRAYATTMVNEAAARRSRWKHGEVADIHAEMMKLTLVIAGETLFGADVEKDAQEVGAALASFMEIFGLIFLPFSQYIERLPVPPMNRIFKARERLDRIVYRLIRERRASGEDSGDLLSMLIGATDVEGDRTGMTDEQLRDECLTIFLAGHETTANALTFAWYLLSQDPDTEAKLHAELDSLGGRLPTVDDIPALRYTYGVFAESLRLFPPAWALGRQAIDDHAFAEAHVPKGSIVLCSQWVMHKDPRYWEQPLTFRPERWMVEDKARPRFAYFPFGAGPRQCIGEGFAWTEGVLLLAAIAQQFRFRLRPGFELATRAAITLRPKAGVPMQILSR